MRRAVGGNQRAIVNAHNRLGSAIGRVEVGRRMVAPNTS